MMGHSNYLLCSLILLLRVISSPVLSYTVVHRYSISCVYTVVVDRYSNYLLCYLMLLFTGVAYISSVLLYCCSDAFQLYSVLSSCIECSRLEVDVLSLTLYAGWIVIDTFEAGVPPCLQEGRVTLRYPVNTRNRVRSTV